MYDTTTAATPWPVRVLLGATQLSVQRNDFARAAELFAQLDTASRQHDCVDVVSEWLDTLSLRQLYGLLS